MIKKGDYVRIVREEMYAIHPNGDRFLSQGDVIKVFNRNLNYIWYLVKNSCKENHILIKNVENFYPNVCIKKNKKIKIWNLM